MKKVNVFLSSLLVAILFANLNAMQPGAAAADPAVDSCVINIDHVEKLIQDHVTTAFAGLPSREQRCNFLNQCWNGLSQKVKTALSLIGVGSGLALVELYYAKTGDLILPLIFGGEAGLKFSGLTQGHAWRNVAVALVAWLGLDCLYLLRICDAEGTATFLLTYMANIVYRHISRKAGVADVYIDRIRDFVPTSAHKAFSGDELV